MLPQFNEIFWVNFWPGLFSGLLVSSAFTFIIVWFVYYLRRPKLEVELSIGHSADSKKFLLFILKNTGRTGLMNHEAQWSLYIERLSGRNGVFLAQEDLGMGEMVIINNSGFYEASGFNEAPCFPGSAIELITIPVKPYKSFPYERLDDARFYVSITTNKGAWHPPVSLFSLRKNKIKYNNGHFTRYIYKITKIVV